MGMGQYFNTFTPYMAPQMNFSGGFPFMYQSPVSSVKQNTAKETEEKRKKEESEKAAQEFMQRMEKIKQFAENAPKIREQINELEKGKKELSATIDKAKNGKESEDGTIRAKETWEDYNKLPFWKKGLRAAGAMILDAPIKLAEGFVGYEHNPETGESEWNWKKGLRNAALAAGCIALTAIPVAGPIISTGLLATGTVCGAVGAVKGINKAVNAKSPEELEQAYQEISTGVIIGAASAAGLRGLGKSVQAAAGTGSTSSAIQTSTNNSMVQFAKDMTINAYKATVQGVKNDQAAVAANGFAKTFASNLKNLVPKLGESKFESSRYNTTQEINTRLNKISAELNNRNITPIQKTLLEQEQAILNAQKAELQNTITKDSWKLLKTNSKLHNNTQNLQNAVKSMKTNGSAEINGTTFNNSSENLSALKEAVKRSKSLSKEIENLAKVRSSTIKRMAFSKKYKTDVETFTGKTRSNRFGRIYDTVKISKSDITWKKALISPLKFAWEATMIAFKPWNYLKNSPSSTFYKVEETLVPSHASGFLSTGFLADVIGMGEQTLTTKIYSTDENGQNVEEVVSVTKETLAQMEEQIKQYDDAITKAKEELNKIYYA